MPWAPRFRRNTSTSLTQQLQTLVPADLDARDKALWQSSLLAALKNDFATQADAAQWVLTTAKKNSGVRAGIRAAAAQMKSAKDSKQNEAARKPHVLHKALLGSLFGEWVKNLPDDDALKKRYNSLISAQGNTNLAATVRDQAANQIFAIITRFTQIAGNKSGDERIRDLLAAAGSERKQTQHADVGLQLSGVRRAYKDRTKYERQLKDIQNRTGLSREDALSIFLDTQYEKIAAEEANKVTGAFSDREAERIDKKAQSRVDRIAEILRTSITPLRSINAPISSDEEGNDLSPADVISDYEDEDFSFAFTAGRPFLPVEKLFGMISGDIQANRDPRRSTLAGIPPLWQDYLIARATSETPPKGTGRSRRVSHKQAMDTLKAEARKNNYTVEVPKLPSRLRLELGITMNDSDFWKALFVYGEAPDKPKSPGESYDLLAATTEMLREDKPLSAFLNNPKRMALLRAARRNTGQPELRSRAALFRGVCPITGETFQKGTIIYKHPKHGWCTQAGLRSLGLRLS